MNYNEIENGVSRVYSIITDGAYNDWTDNVTDVIDEFNFLYGDIANLAYDLEDKLDEVFSECETVQDCVEALRQYFKW